MTTLYLIDTNGIFTSTQQLTNQYTQLPPCTLTPPPETTGLEVAQWLSNRWVVLPEYPQPPGKSPEQLQAEITTATQQRLDDFARTRNYDGILSAASYATDPDPKFAVEGQYAVQARSSTWKKLYEILAEVEAGQRPAPSGFADIENELPALVWPA